MRLTEKATVLAALALVAMATILTGCGGVGDETPPEATAAIVVVGVIDKESQDFLQVPASVVVGSVRGTATVEEGSVVLRDVPFGTDTPPTQPMTVTARGYVTEAYPVQISLTTVTFVTAEMTEVDLTKTGIIEGWIRDAASGLPLASAAVYFEYQPIAGEAVVVKGYTDSDGYYIIGGMPIGRVEATAAAEGYLTDAVVLNVSQAAGSDQPQHLDFELVSGETTVPVSGRVVNVATQQPIVGATVRIGDLPIVETDVQGQFIIPQVLVGQQELVVKASGFDDYRQKIQVAPGMSTLRVQMNEAGDQPPPAPYTISGTVTMLGAPEGARAQVEVFDTVAGAVAIETATDTDGGYRAFVLPGEYQITVSYEHHSISRTVILGGGGQKLEDINFTLTVS
jgi:hypothetical protein